MISSPNNATVRRIRRLRKRAERAKRKAFIAEGHRAVQAALAHGHHPEILLHTTAGAKRHRQLIIDAEDAGARVLEATERVIAVLSSAANPPDVVAVLAMPEPVSSGSGPLLVLAGVKDPATVGSLLASAAASGMRRAVALRGTADLYASTPVRVAAGAHFVVGLGEAPSLEACIEGAPGVRVVSLADEGPPPWDVRLDGSIALVVGDQAPDGETVSVPPGPSGSAAPLAIRAAVAMFEARRQREAL